MPPRLAHELSAAGHQVTHTRDIHASSPSDAQQLLTAARQGGICITRNHQHFELLQLA